MLTHRPGMTVRGTTKQKRDGEKATALLFFS
jgi:hypothetical protein